MWDPINSPINGPGDSSNTNDPLVNILVIVITDSHSLMVVSSLDSGGVGRLVECCNIVCLVSHDAAEAAKRAIRCQPTSRESGGGAAGGLNEGEVTD